MKNNVKIVDYRQLRLSNITTTKFNHLFMLIFWPLFGLAFAWIEAYYPINHYINVVSPLDAFIPFCEWFVIPYVFWFFYIIAMHVYTLLFDVSAFRKMMWYFIVTYSFTLLVYLIFPTCQNLRPESFERDNFLIRFMLDYYSMDTHTNVCPSLHVVGSLAVMFTSWHAKGMEKPWIKLVISAVAVLICLSTVFVKQHSVIDVLIALPICAIAYFAIFRINSALKYG